MKRVKPMVSARLRSLFLPGLLSGLLGVSLVACARRDPVGLSDYQAPLVVAPANPNQIAGIHSARSVLHRGIRVVELFDSAGVLTLSYREDFAADGQGEFSLQPVEALTPVDAAWSIRQGAREGFLARYRDFEIRDAALFGLNWTLTDLAQSSAVAGRPTVRYFVERKVGSSHSYLVDVDLMTGVPLAYEDYDDQGVLVARMRYETFEDTPDLSGAVWFQELLGETTVDPSAGTLAEQAGFWVPLPRAIPAGYYLESTSLVANGSESWVKLIFSDGVQPLFYLFRPLFDPIQSGLLTTGGLPTSVSPANGNVANEIYLFRMGTAGVAQATFAQGTFIAVGKVGDTALGDLVESALP